MATNNRHSAGTGRHRPSDLGAARAFRLVQLLDRREQLAHLAAEEEAHDLPGADASILRLIAIEEAVEQGWPDLFDELVAHEWLVADMARMHTPGEPHPSCAICAAEVAQMPTEPVSDPAPEDWPVAGQVA